MTAWHVSTAPRLPRWRPLVHRWPRCGLPPPRDLRHDDDPWCDLLPPREVFAWFGLASAPIEPGLRRIVISRLRYVRRYITAYYKSEGSMRFAWEGDALTQESLWPPACILNSSTSQARFNPDEPILQLLWGDSLESVTLARWDWTFALHESGGFRQVDSSLHRY
jgi:hypothetical protein